MLVPVPVISIPWAKNKYCICLLALIKPIRFLERIGHLQKARDTVDQYHASGWCVLFLIQEITIHDNADRSTGFSGIRNLRLQDLLQPIWPKEPENSKVKTLIRGKGKVV